MRWSVAGDWFRQFEEQKVKTKWSVEKSNVYSWWSGNTVVFIFNKKSKFLTAYNINKKSKVRWRLPKKHTTAEDVSRFQCLFPNPNWLVWKGIPPPKPLQYPWLMAIFPLVVEANLVEYRQRFGVYHGANVRPYNIAWKKIKKAMFSK